MADPEKARSAFMNLVENLDPDVECVIPEKPSKGHYHIVLSRPGSDDRQFIQVSEKEFLALEGDEELLQNLEQRLVEAIEKLPESCEGGADTNGFDEDSFEDDAMEDEYDDDFGEDEEGEGFEDYEEEDYEDDEEEETY